MKRYSSCLSQFIRLINLLYTHTCIFARIHLYTQTHANSLISLKFYNYMRTLSFCKIFKDCHYDSRLRCSFLVTPSEWRSRSLGRRSTGRTTLCHTTPTTEPIPSPRSTSLLKATVTTILSSSERLMYLGGFAKLKQFPKSQQNPKIKKNSENPPKNW